MTAISSEGEATRLTAHLGPVYFLRVVALAHH